MAGKRKPLRVVRDRIKPLLIALLFAMLGKSLMTSGFEIASWVLMSLSAIALGLRHVSRFHPAKNQYDAGWRLYGVPLKVFRAPLSDIKAVKVEHKIHRGKYFKTSDSDSPDHHYLVSVQGVPQPLVQLIRNHSLKARRLGEQLAKCILCPLHDGSQGRLIKRSPEELDMSLGQRLQHRGKAPGYPSLPAGSHIKPLGLGYEKQLKFPPQPLPIFAIGIFLAILIPIAIVLWFADSSERMAVLLVVIPVVLFLFIGFMSSARPLYLWLSPEILRYRKFPFRGRMEMQDLEEISSRNTDMLLISDKKVMGLPYDFIAKDEASYVRALIEHMAYRSATEGKTNRAPD